MDNRLMSRTAYVDAPVENTANAALSLLPKSYQGESVENQEGEGLGYIDEDEITSTNSVPKDALKDASGNLITDLSGNIFDLSGNIIVKKRYYNL